MKTTHYFEERRNDRPEIQAEWYERVLANPLKTEAQPDGRVRFWGFIPEAGNRVLRVVTPED